ncbi:MAG: RnfABCDGE type electron transport complex subunit A [Candidatus Omnitrophica bacterium]|nr:RnfABCDGE type electron transport complex subunit A [Candidatus Omnitrophota bacterium]
MEISKIIAIAISMVFINNFILSKFLGLCPFLGVSRHTKAAISMGIAVIFVMVFSALLTSLVYAFVLVPLNIVYLRTIFFILIIAAFVQLIEMIIRKNSPPLYKALGIYLPLITTNCAVLGVAILNMNEFFVPGTPVFIGIIYSIIQAFFAGIGFCVALLLMSGIRERLEFTDTHLSMKGIPIAFIVAAIMSLAFMGFSGFKL